mmetsp:Transcript_42227/g.57625  ORF Transcript_42227/g.57625 Transcript_42227/m.57625 type:complete len:83 (-) Transcript_42227:1033-1281(-)
MHLLVSNEFPFRSNGVRDIAELESQNGGFTGGRGKDGSLKCASTLNSYALRSEPSCSDATSEAYRTLEPVPQEDQPGCEPRV